MAALIFLMPTLGLPPDTVAHAAVGTSLMATVFTAARATHAHHRRGAVLWQTAAFLAPGLVIGGGIGTWLASVLDARVLQIGVAAYCFIAAAQLALGQPTARSATEVSPTGPGWIALASGIGAVSSIVGIGGGSMTVPALISAGVAPVRAVATSSACGILIALAGTIGFAFFNEAPAAHGFVGAVFVPGALAAAAGSIATAPIGARIAHRVSGRTLKYVFAVFLMVVGCAVGVQT